jgi:GDP-L-fucose synthase
MLDVQSTAYRKEWGCNFIVAIPTNIYGPNDNFNILNGHVIPALIHKLYLAKIKKESFNVWGTGKPLREFVYSEDIASLSIWALNNYEEEKPIIFTSENEISIKDLVFKIAKILNYEGEIIFDHDKPDGQFRKPSDGTKLKKYLSDFNWTTLEAGLLKTIEWFIENYEKPNKIKI